MSDKLELLLEYSDLIREGICESESDYCEDFSFVVKLKEIMSEEEKEDSLVSFSDIRY